MVCRPTRHRRVGRHTTDASPTCRPTHYRRVGRHTTDASARRPTHKRRVGRHTTDASARRLTRKRREVLHTRKVVYVALLFFSINFCYLLFSHRKRDGKDENCGKDENKMPTPSYKFELVPRLRSLKQTSSTQFLSFSHINIEPPQIQKKMTNK